MNSGSIPGIKWYMSDDNRSLIVKKEDVRGTKEFTTSWTFNPSDDLVNFALDKMLAMMDDKGEMIQGQKNIYIKKGNWIFEIATGPPTWWLPKIQFKDQNQFLFRIGWLKCALGIWKANNKENK